MRAICCCGAGFSLRRASARLIGSETKVPPSRGHRPGKRSEARRRLKPAPQIAISLAALWLASAAGSSAEPLHAYHATKLKIDCSQCHVPVKKDSVTLRRPGHSQCTMCHAMAFRAGKNPRICQECHASAAPSGANDLQPFPRFKGQRPLLAEFSHARHVDKQSRVDSRTGFRSDCQYCHKLAADGKLEAFPQHAECVGCHARPEIRPHLSAASTTRDCRGCHSPEGIESPARQAAGPPPQVASGVWPGIEFSHLAHFRARQPQKLDCVTCHSTVPASASLATLRLPAMLDCVGCHETGHRADTPFRMANCRLCHLDGPSGRLQPSHASNVRPASHNPSFRVQHREQASAPDAKCFACHSSVAPNAAPGERCVSCHQVARPATHTARWRDDIHGRYAALDRVVCATCHTADYCNRCHNELPRTHVPLALFKNGSHARVARLDERACLTCHTFESTCAACHRRN